MTDINRDYDDLVLDNGHWYVPKFKLDTALAEIERLTAELEARGDNESWRAMHATIDRLQTALQRIAEPPRVNDGMSERKRVKIAIAALKGE